MDGHGGEWWFNKSVRAISRESVSGVTALSISAENVSVYIRCRRRVVRVLEGLVIEVFIKTTQQLITTEVFRYVSLF